MQTHVGGTEHCVALMASTVAKHAKTIHHFKMDAKTLLNSSHLDEALALIGCGALAFTVEVSQRLLFGRVLRVTPSFKKMCAMKNLNEFALLTVATMAELKDDPTLNFQGKHIMVLPPFLAKALMDADMEDAAALS